MKEWRLPLVLAFTLLAVDAALLIPAFRAFYGGSTRALGNIVPYTTALTCLAVLFNVTAAKGDTPLGRMLFRIGLGLLSACAVFAAALPFVPIPVIEKEMARASATLLIATITTAVLVYGLASPLWARRFPQRP